MDLRKLKKLIDLVEESGISELELTEGEEKVRISRNSPNSQAMIQPMHMQHMYAAPAGMPAIRMGPESITGYLSDQYSKAGRNHGLPCDEQGKCS